MALTKVSYSMIKGAYANAQDFGVVGDGVTDDTASLQAAASNSGALGLYFGTGLTIRITDTVTFPASKNIDFGTSTVVYAGPSDRPALAHGAVGLGNTATIENISIRAATTSWANVNFTGFRVYNLSRSRVTGNTIRGFTIGYDCYSSGQGYVHNTHIISAILDCKYGTALTGDGAGGGNDYVNENVWLGGDYTNIVYVPGNCYGVWFRTLNSGYNGHNCNRWIGPCFQPGDGVLGEERIPFFFDQNGGLNIVYSARYESGRGPFARLDGTTTLNYVTQNYFDLALLSGTYATGTIQQNGSARLNYIQFCTEPWSWPVSTQIFDVVSSVSAYNPSNIYVGNGLHLTDISGVPIEYASAVGGSIRPQKDSVYFFGTRSVGFFTETTGSEQFSLRGTSPSSATSAVLAVSVYDADFNQLTSASATYPDVVSGTGGNYFNYSSDFGGAYNYGQTNAFVFKVSSAVRYVRCFATSGSIQTLQLTRFSRSATAIRCFSGLLCDGTQRLAIADPDTGLIGSYARGNVVYNGQANLGQPSYWQCTVAGRLAPAWTPASGYGVGDLVLNDTNRIYTCITAGTSAGSGGPTGTGASILDGTCVWDYLSPRATFVPGPNL